MKGKKAAVNIEAFVLKGKVLRLTWEKRRLARENRSLKAVARRLIEALKHSAKHGDVSAANCLGDLYYWWSWNEDLPVKRNPRQALAWYHQAAKRGDATAQKNLGILYAGGLPGLSVNYAKARLWLERSAAQHDSDGQFFLGNLYRLGWGVKKNKAQARKWYEKAATQGHRYARQLLRQDLIGKKPRR